LALPVLIFYFMRFNEKKLGEKYFKQLYGDIYQGIKIKNSSAILYNFYFITRRLFLSVLLYYMGSFVVFQLAFINISSFFIFVYIVSV
jgi:hypothetical protein